MSDNFEDSLEEDKFYARIFHLAIDECHLLLSWGEGFRKPFRQIKVVRNRLEDDVTVSALTATLRGGVFVNSNAILLPFKQVI